MNDIAIGTRAPEGGINRKHIPNSAKDVVQANNPSSLKESGRPLELTDRWTTDLLDSMELNKRKQTTGKIETSPPFRSEEKLLFQPSRHLLAQSYFTPFSSVSIVNLEHVIAGWERPMPTAILEQSTVVLEHDISTSLIVNLDQIPLS